MNRSLEYLLESLESYIKTLYVLWNSKHLSTAKLKNTTNKTWIFVRIGVYINSGILINSLWRSKLNTNLPLLCFTLNMLHSSLYHTVSAYSWIFKFQLYIRGPTINYYLTWLNLKNSMYFKFYNPLYEIPRFHQKLQNTRDLSNENPYRIQCFPFHTTS